MRIHPTTLKKNMKRNLFLSWMMAVAMFGFVGCGGKTTTETTTPPAAAQGTNPDAVGDPNAGKFDPSGSYYMEDDMGTHVTLTVTKSGDKISYTLDAGVGNAAEMTRTASMTLVADKEFEDIDDGCQISFLFGNGSVELAYVGGDYEGCGEIDCAGTYKKQ